MVLAIEPLARSLENDDTGVIDILHAGHMAADEDRLTVGQARLLFTSHALSTWNARMYEFAAILFTAAAFPDTLLMSSLRGLVITLAALLGSSSIGSAIDSSSSRLKPLMVTIVGNRLSIFLATALWLQLVEPPVVEHDLYKASRLALFFVAVGFGILEKLTGIGNMISSERSWIPELADKDEGYTLTVLNATMRRIDLICKLIAPIAISVIVTATSIKSGVLVVGGMSVISCGIEALTAKRVWDGNRRLQRPKLLARSMSESRVQYHSLVQRTAGAAATQYQQLRDYFSTDVWQPSLALALLHLSALSYAATLTTYLLGAGYSLLIITVARAMGSVLEVSSTFIAPVTVQRLAQIREQGYGTSSQHDLEESEDEIHWRREHSAGLARSGLWGVSLQWACLVPVVLALWKIEAERTAQEPSVLLIVLRGTPLPASLSVASISMFLCLSVSRLGLWIFDLTTQEITQTGTEASRRSSFAGTEMAFVSLFELAQWILGAVFPKPEQFPWLALGSLGAVSCSALGYAVWVRQQRGHLVHWHRVKGKCFQGTSSP